MTKRRALITGITGQDGSYLAELLLEKDYEVTGVTRRMAVQDTRHRLHRIWHLVGKILDLREADVAIDTAGLLDIVVNGGFHEIYHLAAQSDVGLSFRQPFATYETNFGGTARILHAAIHADSRPRVYVACSSEQFGNIESPPFHEHTPMRPVSPYGVSKLAAFNLAGMYRRAYGLHVSCGIAFNHESPRRGEEFVTRKIAKAVARIKAGLQEKISLGNLAACRDWGHARDYVDGMWRMLQKDQPDDYVLATGVAHSVDDFLQKALSLTGLSRDVLEVDEDLMRVADVHHLRGLATKAKIKLGWEPRVTFEELVREMVESEIQAVEKEVACL